MLDLVGFDNVSYEQLMLEIEDKKQEQEANAFWSQFPEESADFA